MNYSETLDKATEAVVRDQNHAIDDASMTRWLTFFAVVVTILTLFASIYKERSANNDILIFSFMVICGLAVALCGYACYSWYKNKNLRCQIVSNLYEILKEQNKNSTACITAGTSINILSIDDIRNYFLFDPDNKLQESTIREIQIILATLDFGLSPLP